MADLEYCLDTATPDEVQRIGEYLLSVELRMTKARYAEMGLGCGLADVQEAVLDIGEVMGRHRLVRVDQDPTDDTVLLTRWLPLREYGF